MKRQHFLLLTLAILALDQWSKWMVEAHLPAGLAHPMVPGFLHLSHVRNTGVAFGLLSDPSGTGRWWLITVGLVALAAVTLYFLAFRRSGRRARTGLALLVGGACGNLLDRIFDTRGQGAVTDFVDLQLAGWRWPAFNLADAAIMVGLVLLALEVTRAGTATAKAPLPVRETPR